MRLLLTAFRGVWDVAAVAFVSGGGDVDDDALDMKRLDAGGGGP